MQITIKQASVLPGGWYEFSIQDSARRLRAPSRLQIISADDGECREYVVPANDGRAARYALYHAQPIARVEFSCPGAGEEADGLQSRFNRLSRSAIGLRALREAPGAALQAAFWRAGGKKQRSRNIVAAALNAAAAQRKDVLTNGAAKGPGSATNSIAKEPSVIARYIKQAADHGKRALVSEPAKMEGHFDQFVVTDTGHTFLLGWVNDEAERSLGVTIQGMGPESRLDAGSLVRFRRTDVDQHFKHRGYDYGCLILTTLPHAVRGRQPVSVKVASDSAVLDFKIVPTVFSNDRLLQHALEAISILEANRGREFAIDALLAGPGGATLRALYDDHVQHSSGYAVERFGAPQSPSNTFITVLFGSPEPLAFQPTLFRANGVAFGEWIYVCNSPEIADDVLRLGKIAHQLYGVSIRVVVMEGNVGFGTANNIAVELAESDNIYLINPDVYPLESAAHLIKERLDTPIDATELSGGLLFYNPRMLMHSGMHFERDLFVGQGTTKASGASNGQARSLTLARVEHFEKGIPYREGTHGNDAIEVPAVTGALMAFNKGTFQQLGGFSANYIFGHYEDADLSIRWRQKVGPVKIDRRLRLVHQEGRGSKSSESQYRGAASVNRHIFTNTHRQYLDRIWADDLNAARNHG